jgi:hypothetical protein
MEANVEPQVKGRRAKGKVKLKVSELDPIAAKVRFTHLAISTLSRTEITIQRRREQTRMAQKAFRQRQEAAIQSLSNEVDQLHCTIDGLNKTFLSFTDALTTSEWLENDAYVAGELRNTIRTFLELTQSPHEPSSREEVHTFRENAHKHMKSDVVLKNPEYSPSFSGSSECSATVETTCGHSASSSAISASPAAGSIDNGVALKTASAFANTDVYNRPWPYFSIPSPFLSLSAIQSMSWKPLAVNETTFSRRLHQAAYEEGYRILCNAEQEFNNYQQIFGYMLGTHTRESLFWYLTSALNENLDGVLEPPEAIHSFTNFEVQSSGWLNATEVYHHFRMKGIDFDKYPIVAEIQIDGDNVNKSIASKEEPFNSSMLQPSAPELRTEISNYSDPFDCSLFTYLQNVDQFGGNSRIVSNSSALSSKRRVSVDVTKLISGECLLNCPVTRTSALTFCRNCSSQPDTVPWTEPCL